jgi:hypothetical protein
MWESSQHCVQGNSKMIERNRTVRRTVAFFLAAVSMATASLGAQAEEVYRNDFQRPDKLRKNWSASHRDVTAKGDRTLLGRFGSEAVTLTVDKLPEHKFVRISFELFIVGNWGGTSKETAPDLWQLSVDDGPVLVNASFSLWKRETNPQSFPANYPLARVTANTGAAETNSLGYIYASKGVSDAVYKLNYVVPHRADTVVFNFSALGRRLTRFPEGNLLATWGLDNVIVETLDRRAIVSLDKEQFRQAWENLGSEDAVKAHQAIWALIGAEDATVTFIGKRLGEALAGPDWGKLIEQLDSDDFPIREAATKKLSEMVPFTKQEVVLLETSMRGTKSAEVRIRLSQILKANTSAPASIRPEERRRRRVDYILELIGTDSAKKLLKK